MTKKIIKIIAEFVSLSKAERKRRKIFTDKKPEMSELIVNKLITKNDITTKSSKGE